MLGVQIVLTAAHWSRRILVTNSTTEFQAQYFFRFSEVARRMRPGDRVDYPVLLASVISPRRRWLRIQ